MATTTTSQPLAGKFALVTGGGRGIGAGVALELAKKGASVAINYANSASSAEAVVEDIRTYGVRAVAIKADLTKVEQIDELFRKVIDEFGYLDIVVSNSGMEKFAPLTETTLEEYNRVFDLNTRAQFFVAKNALVHIRPRGTVVLTSSIAAGMGIAGHALYAGSKSAVDGFTRCFAADFGAKRCTVNSIAPGGVKSDMFTNNAWRYAPGCDRNSSMEEIEKSLASLCPLGRVGVPADIGRIVAFLASEEGEWINGEHFVSSILLLY